MSHDWLELYTLHSYDNIDSTNLEAKRLIAHNNLSGRHVLWALFQSKGYGKSSRKWESGIGDITFSLINEHSFPEMLICQLLFIAAISVREILEKIFLEHNINVKLSLKWPNDIMVEGRKISGILIENLKSPDGRSFVVIGIGINNIFHSSGDLQASSLSQYNIEIDPTLIIKNIVTSFENYKNIWSKYGLGPIRKIWTQHAHGIDEIVTVKSNKSDITGIFKGINNSGAMNILLDSGLTTSISIGEIFFNPKH
jgi:BirA family biotin operon repressor/biotin-[acetyl-CoA-carboxylase] ligase